MLSVSSVLQAHYSVLYRATSAPAFSFTTTLDLFVYLNGERIVNMGGVHALNTTTVDLTTVSCTSPRLPLQGHGMVSLQYAYREGHCLCT